MKSKIDKELLTHKYYENEKEHTLICISLNENNFDGCYCVCYTEIDLRRDSITPQGGTYKHKEEFLKGFKEIDRSYYQSALRNAVFRAERALNAPLQMMDNMDKMMECYKDMCGYIGRPLVKGDRSEYIIIRNIEKPDEPSDLLHMTVFSVRTDNKEIYTSSQRGYSPYYLKQEFDECSYKDIKEAIEGIYEPYIGELLEIKREAYSESLHK